MTEPTQVKILIQRLRTWHSEAQPYPLADDAAEALSELLQENERLKALLKRGDARIGDMAPTLSGSQTDAEAVARDARAQAFLDIIAICDDYALPTGTNEYSKGFQHCAMNIATTIRHTLPRTTDAHSRDASPDHTRTK